MVRNKFGQFEKGTCGNPRGRPRKKPPEISDTKLRQDFFDVAQTPIAIVEDGKRKLVPAHVAIQMQLVKKALSGDTRAIVEFTKTYQRYCLEHAKCEISKIETVLNCEDIIRRLPEDVTDEFKRLLKCLKASLDPYFRID